MQLFKDWAMIECLGKFVVRKLDCQQ